MPFGYLLVLAQPKPTPLQRRVNGFEIAGIVDRQGGPGLGGKAVSEHGLAAPSCFPPCQDGGSGRCERGLAGQPIALLMLVETAFRRHEIP